MKSVFLRDHTQRLSIQAGQLIQMDDCGQKRVHPICCTEQVEVYGNGQITTQAIKECLKEGVRINYYSSYGRYLGRLEPDYPKNIRRRLEQYRLYFDTERRVIWCKGLLGAKIQGELVELRRQKEQGKSFPYEALRRGLQDGLWEIEKAKSVPELLGVEGRCAKIYYEMFRHILPKGIPWQGRSYHPAGDGMNELLSCTYGILARCYREEIEHWSLDPHCGFLHEPRYGGGGLAYDLLEIQRATFCDHLVLRLLKSHEEFAEVARRRGGEFLDSALFFQLKAIVEESMVKRYRLQKQTPRQQMERIVEMTVKELKENGAVPDYQAMHPVR